MGRNSGSTRKTVVKKHLGGPLYKSKLGFTPGTLGRDQEKKTLPTKKTGPMSIK